MKKYITLQDYHVNSLCTQEEAYFGKPRNGTLSIVKLDNDHKCNGCLNEGYDTMMGFSWFNTMSELKCQLCMNCIHDCVLSFKAKESWQEKNGDPIKDLQETIKKLERRIEDLEVSAISDNTFVKK